MQRILYTSLDSISLAGLNGESSNPVEYQSIILEIKSLIYLNLGISLPELWTILESELQVTIDDFMKNWIWQQIQTSKKIEYFISDKVCDRRFWSDRRSIEIFHLNFIFFVGRAGIGQMRD